ncbi:MAG: acyl-CoA dehydrogenase family protein [Aridibacter famidurans]|nr:acyl-CoA dehydrogenase family protein [Aridibacter famidurans]
MPAVAETTVEGILGKLEDLRPLIEEHSDEAERNRCVSAPVSRAMLENGFFRMMRPETVGGLGLDPVTCFRMIEEVSRIDSAVGWNVGIANGFEPFGAWGSKELVRRVMSADDTVLCGGFFPPRKAVKVDGGYRISGRTQFNSNCNAATWVCGEALIFESDDATEPLKYETGAPMSILTFFPIEEAEIIDNWDTLGMCGTGSHDVEVTNVFLPEEQSAPFIPLSDPEPEYAGPLHRLSIWPAIACVAAPAFGIAQSAIDDFIELGKKVPSYTSGSLASRPVVQLQLGEAEAKVAAARALFHNTYDGMWQKALDGECLELEDRSRCQMACSYAVKTAAEAVDLIHLAAGSSAIRNEKRFQRHFRDIHVLTQHAFVSESRLQSVGQISLGAEPEWPFFAL